MFVLFLVTIFSSTQFADIDSLNNILKPFLEINDSITCAEDDLYKFFNKNTADIILSSENDENRLKIKFHNKETNVLPKCLRRLINIHCLFLQENNLMELPRYFTKFTSLYILNLSSNKFKKLPEVLFPLKNLIILDLHNNWIKHIDDNIKRLNQLTFLDFSGNKIKSVSKNLKKLTSLEYLNLSYNINIIRTYYSNTNTTKDKYFCIKIPTSIEVLHLSNIRLRHIPEDFKLSRLSIVSLQNNFLETLPNSFSECRDISTLDLSYNKFKTIPSCLYYLEKLKTLKLNGNNLKYHLYIKNDMLLALTELDLSCCDINKFEVEGYNIIYYDSSSDEYIKHNGHMKNISKHSQDVSSNLNYHETNIVNSMKTFSITITNTFTIPNILIFPNLVSLKIVNRDSSATDPRLNRFVFSGLQKMKLLKNLELISFNFVRIPKEICSLKSLQSLILNFCKIKEIPNEILTLQNLEKIDLRRNDIKKINPKIFQFNKKITIALGRNPFKYLPPEINNNNLNFTLELDKDNLAPFKKDNDHLGLLDISYKKIHNINRSTFLKNYFMYIKDIYNTVSEGEYKWDLNQILAMRNKEAPKSKKGYSDIVNHWNILENYITDITIKEKFRSYLQQLYDIKNEATSDLLECIKDNIKNYVDAVFEILINFVKAGSTEIIETIVMTVYPGLSVCVDGQFQHFSYAYHLLTGDYDESITIDYFINNKIAWFKYDALREITTNINEEQNVHIFLYWQSELSETLGLPFCKQLYGMNVKSRFLQSREYILYQFFKFMSVSNIVKDLYESINKSNETITMASQYIYNKNHDMESLKEYLKYKGDIEYLKITGITKKGIYFILEDMCLIKKKANYNIFRKMKLVF